MAAQKKSRGSRPAPVPNPRRNLPSSPEIKVAYAPLGRETLEAIASELVPDPAGLTRGRPAFESTPEIVIGTTPVGRETLAAIDAELAAARPVVQPRARARRGRSSRPPSTKTRSEPARKTLRPSAAPSPEIYEVLTFVVKNTSDGDLATEELRRSFVGRHLDGRLRNHSLDSIARVDVTPWTERGTLVLRVWCRV